MKVLIHGFYGAGNAGDDAILHSIIRTLKQVNHQIEIVVIAWSKNIKAYYGDEKIDYIYGLDFKRIAQALKESALLIVGGGGLFQDYNTFAPENLFIDQKGALNYYSAPIILAKMLNIKTMLYAVGVGPLASEESKRAMKWIGEMVDSITVRDAASAQLLTSLGISKQQLSADPVITLPAADQTNFSLNKKTSLHKYIGLNLRNWSYDRKSAKKAEHQLISVLNQLSEKYLVTFVIMSFNKLPSELEKARQLAKRLKGDSLILPYDCSPEEYKSMCRELDLMIAMRLHASIFALSEGVPSIGLSYDDKVSGLYQELDLKPYCFPIEEIDISSLRMLIEDCLINPQNHRRLIQDNVTVLQERERINQTVLMKMLGGM
ncbi:polysaccharide pyruvyl transferase family protein [Anoxybacillus sp. PDR2]|jgi:polysaccharide pyruvyl transferase CsaB|uniref:polysaccharide pyruvyl transferase family protein n=1 Tax=Anoxybacillaceae TaxID=3120669 RepID=UPI001315BF9B|nr:polysaccharide pyruvyl transferase family protein [Anoxybacillus sp. PDR2]QHC05258.1 hypothetical protein GRQ40_15860 [Anoxybacillus sp. PDR2]